MRRKKNAFTLIELIAVLVILAILALIVTPLVMNIVKKAKDSANKRSVDAYGKAVELAVATYLLDNGDYPTDLNSLTVEYSGNEVVCNIQTLNEDGSIYLSECSVSGTDVKDSSTEDGWYHYGKLLNENVTYQAYKVGDTVTYNGMNFYVIENSDEKSDRVTMLKAVPLTVAEVNTYGTDENGINHVNNYTLSTSGIAYDINDTGYGGMSYYSSSTCGYVDGEFTYDGCITDYDKSEVKYVVDAWSEAMINQLDLVEDGLGYKTRILSYEDLTNNLGLVREDYYLNYGSNNVLEWLHIPNYYYWTMSQHDNFYQVWSVRPNDGNNNFVGVSYISSYYGDFKQGIRPVITLSKIAIK